jgi:hypothetical protein
MTVARRAAVLALLGIACSVVPCAAQAVAAITRPVLTPQEMEAFLLHAEIGATRKSAAAGTTSARRVTLSDGRTTHDAQIQDVDIQKPFFDVAPRSAEINFKDTYRYNIAAYRLSRLLGLEEVPMSVPRTVDGRPAAVTWWIDDVIMDEGTRQQKKVASPSPSRTASYTLILRVFDELIQNRDRNAGNLLWTSDWKMWMIDHTRAFRSDHNLLKPLALQRCERTLLDRMRGLTAASVMEGVGGMLTTDEIEALMARRDALVKLFDARIAQRGEMAVLYTLSR